jgi:cell pole-organizing protein PopZ
VNAAAPIEKDLTDRIADALPAEVRADFYRELRHCRSLPENDEMLRILRAMQFLTLLIDGAPSRLAVERHALDHSLSECSAVLVETVGRLDALPSKVASGISPEVIAGKINESLRQQFVQSTIPQTGDALAVVAAQIKRAIAEFQQASATVTQAHHHAASETEQAARRIETSVRAAASASNSATEELRATFLHEYRWSIAMIAFIALITGVILGMAYERSRLTAVPDEPVPEVKAPVVKSKR